MEIFFIANHAASTHRRQFPLSRGVDAPLGLKTVIHQTFLSLKNAHEAASLGFLTTPFQSKMDFLQQNGYDRIIPSRRNNKERKQRAGTRRIYHK